MIDVHFFKNWSQDMAYILGYIAADGCLIDRERRKTKQSILNITSKDEGILTKISTAMNSRYKISKKSNGSGNYAFQIQISNPLIVTDLREKGITKRKSLTLKPINVPNKYFRDFFRGFFDGDGSVFIYSVNNTPQIKCEIVCASKNFLKDLNEKLCRTLKIPEKTIHISQGKINKLFSIAFYIQDSEALGNMMYDHSPNLYLERKKKIFDEWKSTARRTYRKNNYPSKIGWKLNSR